MKKALLFVNGQPPKNYPDNLIEYQYIACTDGAYHNYLESTSISPNFIIGDLDSIHEHPIPNHIKIIHTPDQNKTDFEKALLFLADKGVKSFTVYGASGHASDHFIGNLSVAMQYNKQFELTFYDDFCQFFFTKPNTILEDVKNKTISLLPLSPVKNLTISGFKYPLTNANLQLGGLTSLRNKAIDDEICIDFDSGDLLVFITL